METETLMTKDFDRAFEFAVKLARENKTYSEIAYGLNSANFVTSTGRSWYGTDVSQLMISRGHRMRSKPKDPKQNLKAAVVKVQKAQAADIDFMDKIMAAEALALDGVDDAVKVKLALRLLNRKA